MEIIPPALADYQKKILNSKARFTITEASTKAGKTYSHIIWLFSKAHENRDSNGKNYWWVAPVYNQAKIAFKRIQRYLEGHPLYGFNESSLIIKCPNGAEIHFKSAEKPDNLYGEDVYAAVFDEAPRARPESWYALRSTLTATEAPCKLIGNFGGLSNWVHKLKEKADRDPQYEYFKVTCWDAIREGILSEEEVLQAKRDLPEKIFQELYEAEASEIEGQLILNESIAKLFGKNKVKEGVKYITCDVARFGKDKTVIIVWSGYKVVYIKTMNTSSIPEVVEAIRSIQRLYNVNLNNIAVDEDGVGGGVKDYLRCRGFVNNATPIKVKGEKQNFSNLKTQCYFKLSETINMNLIDIECDEDVERYISEELEWVRLPKEVDTSKISLLSKEKVKEGLGRSPDYSDALMIRMLFDFQPIGNYDIR